MTTIDERAADVPDGTVHYALDDRFKPGTRPVLLTGVQAIARLLVEQQVRDAAAGQVTGTLLSGYQGSPLGGLDKLIASLPQLRTDHGVHLVPGLNEELGATAVWGSQNELQGFPRTVDGVVGVWYGKGPGLDRATDAIKHATTYGAHPRGGALVLAGDDPGSKSSTVPCVSERSLAAMNIPVLFPRNAEEVVTLGLYGVALSRLSGHWVALKIVADVADGLWTVDRDFSDVDITAPSITWEGQPWTYQQRTMLSPPESLVAEADVLGPRWEMVEAFRDANPVDVLDVDPDDAWLTIIASGTAYEAVRAGLAMLGVDRADLASHGVRMLRVGMPYPLGGPIVRRATRGVETVLVVEEKVSFLEAQVKEILYGSAQQPRVLGKRGADGERLVPPTGALTGARVQDALRAVLGGRLELAPPPPAPRTQLTLSPVKRTPYFCSGCPHNTSTVLPDGSIGGGGIGCHTMVTMSDRAESQVTGLTQMGGEGAQWIGQSPFVAVDHIFQNLGDGTYFHSGQLAVQASIAAGTNITYKVLYNSAVAMTGAQDAEGGLPVPDLTRKLHAEGVRRIIVCADDPAKYGPDAHFAPGVEVWHRDRLDEAQRLLREISGTTVLVYDQQCAAEKRRLSKRVKPQAGVPAKKKTLVIIDESVCEGCGDCGAKSNCLSVMPVETELGRKTRIDQTTCNTDYSCIKGDCPSFITVEVGEVKAKPQAKKDRPKPPTVADPVLPTIDETFDIFLAGIGGTGIVTVNAVLATAALRNGQRAVGLDQTGLSQKAGPVTSHLRISDAGYLVANRVGPGTAHAYLAFDSLVGADPLNLTYAAAGVTTMIASTSETATGEQVREVHAQRADHAALRANLAGRSRSLLLMDHLEAAEQLLGSTASANLLLVGAAFQSGALPFPASAIEWAITLNGVAVDANIAAFRWGRVAVADPEAFRAATTVPTEVASHHPQHGMLARSPLTGETRRLVDVRVGMLIDYQGKRLARSYIDAVEALWAVERRLGDKTALSEAVARSLHHVAAYKDEYEVARLLTSKESLAHIQQQVPGATNVQWNLHPPMLKAMGMKDKIKLPQATRPMLVALAKGKGLRGTPLDPFGKAHLRQVERALRDEHWASIAKLCRTLTAETYDLAVAKVEAILFVRGYEDVKLRSIEHYRTTVAGLEAAQG